MIEKYRSLREFKSNVNIFWKGRIRNGWTYDRVTRNFFRRILEPSVVTTPLITLSPRSLRAFICTWSGKIYNERTTRSSYCNFEQPNKTNCGEARQTRRWGYLTSQSHWGSFIESFKITVDRGNKFTFVCKKYKNTPKKIANQQDVKRGIQPCQGGHRVCPRS